ncbi:thiamine phosphate synthase, partial [Eubacterium aggregans]
MNCAKDLLLYAVTDRYWLGNHTLAQDVEAALKGGATMIQLREKTLCDEDFLAEAKVIKAMCAQYNVPFIINDNVAIARACDADGIHVGQRDMEADDVRALIGSTKLLGVSAQTVEQALLAQSMGADYLGVGAVYTTRTKADADNVSMDTMTDI